MSGIFISYRRGDSGPYAGRLYDSLSREFPNNRVFMDIDTIAPGDDFLEEIDKVLSVSRIVVAVIGPRWEDATDKSGRRRLDNQDDFIVHELGMALEAGVRVIPVLVGDAGMPPSEALPLRLKPLARRQAIEISDTRFTFDTARLCTAIKKVLSSTDKGAKSQDSLQASGGQALTSATASDARLASTTRTPPHVEQRVSQGSISITTRNNTDPILKLSQALRRDTRYDPWVAKFRCALWIDYLISIAVILSAFREFFWE